MSATIIYSIDSGKAPFRVWLWGTSYPMQIGYSTGTYTFDNVECGEYTIVIKDAEDCTFEIPLTYPCPATTTTTEEPIITTTTTEIVTTTTTEALEEYPCNYPINYYGYEYEEIIQINLGAATGAVLFDFNFFYIPVKVIVEFDSVEVINTGYRGNVVNQSMLNAALIALDEPTETINPVSQGILAFIKTTATTYAIVKIYTPLAGSIASIKLRCPATLVETWSAEFDDHVCIEEVATTTTTTPIPVTTTTTEASLVLCLDGLVIETIYVNTIDDLVKFPPEYSHPCPSVIGKHVCNRAYYEVFGNGVFMGASRLNNDGGTGGGLSPESGYYTCQDYLNYPPAEWGSGWDARTRYDKTVLTESQAQAIVSAGGAGTQITLSYLYKGQSYGGNCGGGHIDINWLRISAPNGDLIWNSCVVGDDVFVFDVCNYVPILPYSELTLKYNALSTSCLSESTVNYYGNTNSFSVSSKLYSDTNLTLAPAGYYSDESIWRYWDGNAFTSEGCCVDSCNYGLLYNFPAVNTGKLAPAGWHVPTNTEVIALQNYLGGVVVAGGKMKAEGDGLLDSVYPCTWRYPNTGGTNESGFTAYPCGFRYGWSGAFDGIGRSGYFWSSTEHDASNAKQWSMFYDNGYLINNNGDKKLGFSIRCIRDTATGWTPAEKMQDYDGNLYDTIQIGSQIWAVQNLKVTHYNDGEAIPNIEDDEDWAALTTGALCAYDNNWGAYVCMPAPVPVTTTTTPTP